MCEMTNGALTSHKGHGGVRVLMLKHTPPTRQNADNKGKDSPTAQAPTVWTTVHVSQYMSHSSQRLFPVPFFL